MLKLVIYYWNGKLLVVSQCYHQWYDYLCLHAIARNWNNSISITLSIDHIFPYSLNLYNSSFISTNINTKVRENSTGKIVYILWLCYETVSFIPVHTRAGYKNIDYYLAYACMTETFEYSPGQRDFFISGDKKSVVLMYSVKCVVSYCCTQPLLCSKGLAWRDTPYLCYQSMPLAILPSLLRVELSNFWYTVCTISRQANGWVKHGCDCNTFRFIYFNTCFKFLI